MDQLPWYHEGLRFQCSACGDCCTGSPGFVWVNQEEIESIASEVGAESVEQFEDIYVRRVGTRRSLREYPDGACVFFDNETRKCQIYQVRPRQCGTWPFWDTNVQTPEDWEYACEKCPGSGEGRLYSLEEIEQIRSVIRI